MGIQDTTDTNLDTEFDEVAAAGLSDEEYLAADAVATGARAAGSDFDEVAAAGLSDEEYLASNAATSS